MDGTVEQRAEIIAGGDVVVRGGIIGARVQAGGSLYAKFIQDSEVEVGEDLVVRNYVQQSQVQVQRKATIQGDEGGPRQLCVLGGALQAGVSVEAASIGSAYGRQTRVVAGVDPEVEARLARYRRGLSFAETQSRRVMRSILNATGGSGHKRAIEKALQEAPKGRREFLMDLLKKMQEVAKLHESLDHHIEELKEAQKETAGRGRIRVTGTAFPKVTMQLGETYQILSEEVAAVTFYLNKEQQIARDLLAGGEA
ncbi:MAG: FapA family protein [bacterium]|nr:FapA family protein [bacterium]